LFGLLLVSPSASRGNRVGGQGSRAEEGFPGIERVVYGNRRFFVVEKLGQAGEIADNANPRR
jgi:hypothetical protein